MRGMKIRRGVEPGSARVRIPKDCLSEEQALSFMNTLAKRMRKFQLLSLEHDDPNYWVYVGLFMPFVPRTVQSLGIRVDKLYNEFKSLWVDKEVKQ